MAKKKASKPSKTSQSAKSQATESPEPTLDPSITNTVELSVPMPVAMVSEIDEYARYVAERRFRNVTRRAAIHSLLAYSLEHWRKKYVDGDGDQDEPSLF